MQDVETPVWCLVDEFIQMFGLGLCLDLLICPWIGAFRFDVEGSYYCSC